MIRALLFDMDGTLVDSEAQTDAAIAEVLARRGHPNFLLPPSDTRGRTWGDIVKAIHDRTAVAVPEEELVTAWSSAVDSMQPIPGAAEAVREGATRFAIAVVSSSPRALVERLLRQLGVLDVVTVRVGGDDVARPKPDPEGFLRAASLLGCPPASCVVFEDSRAGHAAARAAGMHSVLVTTRCDEPDFCLPLATFAIEHYAAAGHALWDRVEALGDLAR